ncbi:MAG: hypothetical protein C5B47_08810, partial [Verrucomicrobia bacterium]
IPDSGDQLLLALGGKTVEPFKTRDGKVVFFTTDGKEAILQIDQNGNIGQSILVDLLPPEQANDQMEDHVSFEIFQDPAPPHREMQRTLSLQQPVLAV